MTKIVLSILAAVVLFSCSSDNPGPALTKENNCSSFTICEVRLEDGTRCVIARSYNKGGITCDWQGKKRVEK